MLGGVPSGEYLLPNRQEAAAGRLRALGELFDPVTRRHLLSLGLGPGWRCWEVGAGGPSVPSWLAAQVGPAGEVLATDLDVTRLGAGDGFRVLRHDVANDPVPGAGFDLVHARLVLVHVPQRDEVVANLVAALRPGGWLLLEDADPGLQPLLCPDESGPAQALGNRIRRVFRELLEQRGADLAFGRTLPGRLRAAGLSDVGADAYFPIASAAATDLELATIAQLREELLASGRVSAAELDEHVANVSRGDMDLATAPLVSAWGRRTQ